MSERYFEQEPVVPRILEIKPSDEEGAIHVCIDKDASAEDFFATLACLEPDEAVSVNYRRNLVSIGIDEFDYYGEKYTSQDLINLFVSYYGKGNIPQQLIDNILCDMIDDGVFADKLVKINYAY